VVLLILISKLFFISRGFLSFGTIFELKVFTSDSSKTLFIIDSAFNYVSYLDSIWRRYWEGYVFKGETLSVPEETDSLLVLSLYWAKKTKGIFPERIKKRKWFFPEGAIFDPGGIAKGFVLDLVKKFFERKFIKKYLLNFGGSSLYAKGEFIIEIYGKKYKIKDEFISVSHYKKRNKKNLIFMIL